MTKLPNFGSVKDKTELKYIYKTTDGCFQVGQGGVENILATKDGSVEFVGFKNATMACINSSKGYSAYYPIHPVKIKKPIKAVLMDLDGTTVQSEDFWISMISRTIQSLLNLNSFEFESEDIPHISGHSISKHLKYCINKYCPNKTIEEAINRYYTIVQKEINNIKSDNKDNLFKPTQGLKSFLLELKAMNIKIALVTSGTYEKVVPEVESVFRELGLGAPEEFYDTIITAGLAARKGKITSIGELCSKPHPWLYAEACTIGLGIRFEERNNVVGIDDSGAGVSSIRIAGFPAIGFAGGNIKETGTRDFCIDYCQTFEQIIQVIK